ncbi:MAG: transposase [Xanthomonadales bacterium]|nr:transposase [Xanthomonadales bacterium]
MRQTAEASSGTSAKLHIGVDSRTGLTHSAVVTAANVPTNTHWLTCCTEERRVYGDSAVRVRRN